MKTRVAFALVENELTKPRLSEFSWQ